jgi:hypothetical protein
MFKRTIPKLLLISVFSCMASGVAPATAGTLPKYVQMSQKVHFCEENVPNGWHVSGPLYFGGLGWLSATWNRYKLPGFPARADLATPIQQSRAMLRFVTIALNGHWPDNLAGDQCTGSY